MKLSKKLLSLLLCAIMVLGSVAVGGEGFVEVLDAFSVKASAASYSDGTGSNDGWADSTHIRFGSYPQTDVTDSLGAVLNNQPGTWVSYNYYSGNGSYGSMKPSNYMRYKDVSYNGNKYRAVTFDTYRSYWTEDATSTSCGTYQDDNGYLYGNVYWFKYEPIKWRVLDPSTGLVMCDTAIDSQAYNNYIISSNGEYYGDPDCTYYASNYAKSSIREWLNKDFYNTAFSSSQQSNILYTTLDNSAYSTSYSAYDSESTTDKVFLLSYDDVLNSKYGFSTSTGTNDSARQLKGSDYAKSQGLYVYHSSDSSYDGCSLWRLRSPGYLSYYTCIVYRDGHVCGDFSTNFTCFGVVPALKLNLASEIFQSDVTEAHTSPSDGDYKITLDANGGKFSDGTSTKTYYYDAGENLPSSLLSNNKPTKNGYTFNRWNDILPLTMPSKDITFKAEWKAEEETYINGIMNDYVTTVVLNGSSSHVSSMTVDGIKYSALNDGIKDSECSALKNKAVVLTMFAGKVKAVEPFSNYSSISVDSGIVSGIGYKTGTEENIEIDVSNAVSSKIKPVSSAILGSSSQSITVGSVTVKLSNKDGSYNTIASSSTASTIGINQTKSLLKTKVTLKTDNVTSSGYAYIIIDISGTQNGKSFNQTETKYFEVLSNSEWRKIENNSVKNQQKATDEDNTRVANAISNNASNLKLSKTIAWHAFIADAFTDAQLNALGYAMVSTIVMADEPKKTFKQYVTDKCLDKIGLEHEIPIGGFDVEVPMIVRVDSKNYGQLVIEFKAKATNFTAKSKKYASFGQITYEVIGGTGIGKVPDYFKSGLAGAIAYTNIDNFASAVREIALAEIERAYNIGYGNEFEEVSEIFFNDTIVDVMVSACKTDYKGAFFDLMTHPTTKYYNQCPTEIYVYDGDNLCASIADGQAVSIDESVEVSLVGSEKTVTISGFNPEKYKIKIVALANGTMNTVIQDIAGGTRAYREQEFLSTSILENDVYYINELGGVADTTKRDTIVSDSKTISSTDDYLYSFGNTDDEPVIDATDYLEYTVSNGKATIIGCDRDVKGKLIIPQTIDGYTIIGIGNTAFANCKDITEITIPATVQNIGYGIFGGCSKLSKIIVDANNKNFSSDDDGILFNKNRTELIQYPIGSTITEYTVPYGTEKIGDSAFVYSSFLKKINLPESVIEIGQGSFAGCSVLEYVHIPSSVKTIGDVILYSNSMYPCTAYICSDSNNCYAKTYAQANNYTFRLCSSHNGVKNPTAHAVINVATEQKIDYRSIVTIKATAKNIPDGYMLAMYIDGKTVKGTNTEVNYEYGELKSDLNYSVKVIDSNGKVQKDSNGNDLSKDSKITVNAGFFKKLIAFFKGLFKSLPKVEVKP